MRMPLRYFRNALLKKLQTQPLRTIPNYLKELFAINSLDFKHWSPFPKTNSLTNCYEC